MKVADVTGMGVQLRTGARRGRGIKDTSGQVCRS